MYPSLDVSTPAASLAATAGQQGASGASYCSGGGDATTSNDGPLFPLLRVQVNSKLRVAPQVMIPQPDSDSAADAVPRSNFSFDFELEKKAVEKAAAAAAAAAAKEEEAEGGTAAAAAAPSSSSSSSWTPPDPWSSLFEQHKDAARVEVAFAAALAAQVGGGGETTGGESGSGGVERSLEPLRQLTAMGFDPRQALGALAVSGGDLAAATDACLAAAANSGARM